MALDKEAEVEGERTNLKVVSSRETKADEV